MGMDYSSQRHVMLGGANSNLTGNTWFTQDYRQISVSVESSTASASRYTIMGTNADGLDPALPLGTPSQTINAGGWSLVTFIVANGIYSITPGMRWLTAFRDTISVSAASNVTMTLVGRA